METTNPSLPPVLAPILVGSELGDTPLSWISSTQVPAPFHQLLVHEHDMTSGLASFHGEAISLHVLRSQSSENTYLREVTLHTASSGKCVEYGLIAIMLDSFPEEIRPRILAGNTPLGTILNESKLHYHSEPQGFFTIPTGALQQIFSKSPTGEILYGRYNHLIHEDGSCLARILEIVPPTSTPH
jgi:chorismate-pyruvate lyase